jgi:hypothetical protein
LGSRNREDTLVSSVFSKYPVMNVSSVRPKNMKPGTARPATGATNWYIPYKRAVHAPTRIHLIEFANAWGLPIR